MQERVGSMTTQGIGGSSDGSADLSLLLKGRHRMTTWMF